MSARLHTPWWVVPLWCIALPLSAFAQPRDSLNTASPLDLAHVLASVQTHNLTLQAEELEYRALETRRRQVTALPDPRVSVTVQPYPVYTALGTQRSQWRVEQAIPFPGTLRLRGEVAAHDAGIAREEAATYALDAMLEAKRAFFTLYRVQQMLARIRMFEERLVDFEAAARAQYETGGGPQQAILKAQIERNALMQRTIALQAERTAAGETLVRLTDGTVMPATRVALAPPSMPAASPDSLLSQAYRLRPEVAALALAERRASVRAGLARKAAMPEFGVHLTYFDIARASVPPTASGRDALGIGVTVTLPLQRDRLRALDEEARLRQQQAALRAEALAVSLETHLTDVLSRLLQEERQLTLIRDALLPQARAALEATLASYATGRTSFLDLLDAERTLFSLEMGYEDAFARFLTVHAMLERALGVEHHAK